MDTYFLEEVLFAKATGALAETVLLFGVTFCLVHGRTAHFLKRVLNLL